MNKKPKAKPNDGINAPREGDNWAPGQRSDGTMNDMTVEEALKAIGERNAYEAAFSYLDDDDASDISDLDDDIPA